MRLRTLILAALGIVLAIVSQGTGFWESLEFFRTRGWIVNFIALVGVVLIFAAAVDAFPEIRAALAKRIEGRPPITFDLGQFAEIVQDSQRVSELEKEVDNLRQATKRRRLTDQQNDSLRQLSWGYLDKDDMKCFASVYFVDFESRLYANDFFEMFKSAGWRVRCYDYKGPRKGMSGITVAGAEPDGPLVKGFMEDLMSVGIREVYRALYSTATPKELVLIIGEKETYQA